MHPDLAVSVQTMCTSNANCLASLYSVLWGFFFQLAMSSLIVSDMEADLQGGLHWLWLIATLCQLSANSSCGVSRAHVCLVMGNPPLKTYI